MALKTLKTVVLKTVSVGSVKLPTPADRIGLGVAAVATYPADVLSPGQFPLPPNPAPETESGLRQALPATHSRERMRAMASAAVPAGSAGVHVPGSAARRPWSLHRHPISGWQATTKRAAGTGRLGATSAVVCPAGASRDRFPGSVSPNTRLGRDCQSPDRGDDRRTPDAARNPAGFTATRKATPTTTAGK